MSDLVKRLRYLGDHASFEPHMHHTAADRIEELEAKLAMAVDALQAFNSFDDLPVEARTPDIFQRNVRMPILRTLAAIKETPHD